jgi:hypothetical protein
MKTSKRSLWNVALAAGAAGLFVSDNVSPTAPSSFLSQADARVGRPLTPVSVAGVARRTTRRTVAVGAAAGAAAYGARRYCGDYPYPACY